MSHKRLDLHQIVLASNSTSLACTSGRSFQRPSPNSYDGVREGPGCCSLNNRNLVYMIVAAAAVDLHLLSYPCQGWHTLMVLSLHYRLTYLCSFCATFYDQLLTLEPSSTLTTQSRETVWGKVDSTSANLTGNGEGHQTQKAQSKVEICHTQTPTVESLDRSFWRLKQPTKHNDCNSIAASCSICIFTLATHRALCTCGSSPWVSRQFFDRG